MASVNKVILVGNLGGDPEARAMADGRSVCTFSIACSERYKNRAGDQVDRTEWIRIVAFDRTAELAVQYLHKGSQVYIDGRLQTRKWHDKDGADRYSTEVICDRMQFLGSKRDEAAKPARAPVDDLLAMPDDIPY
jgi:single-strand DNA-binding protein